MRRTQGIAGLVGLVAFAIGDFACGQPAFPLVLSNATRNFVDQTNVPFLVNGDTPWSLITGVTKTEADTYLEDRRAKRFNAILVNLIEHFFNGPRNQEGQLPFLTPGDFSTPNEAYFAHADWVINKAAEKGIVVFLTPAYLGFDCGEQGWCQEMIANGPAKMRDYGRWIGARYRNLPNIVWVAGGDADARNTFGALEATNAMVQGILEQDDQHVVTAHCNRFKSALDCYNQPWLGLNSTYANCSGPAAYARTDYERSSGMPFFFIEGGYEGDGSSAQCVRGQAYVSVLSGSTGHFYGNTPIWLFDPGWESALNASAATTLQYFAALFESRNWSGATPDFSHAVLTNGVGSITGSDYAPSMLTSGGQTFIAYLPSSRSVTVDLTKIAGSQSNAWWFNPRTGAASAIGTFPDAATQQFSPPASGDWVLVIDDAAANLQAPGTTSIAKRPQPPTNLRAL